MLMLGGLNAGLCHMRKGRKREERRKVKREKRGKKGNTLPHFYCTISPDDCNVNKLTM